MKEFVFSREKLKKAKKKNIRSILGKFMVRQSTYSFIRPLGETIVSPVFPVSTPLEINLLMLENSSLLCPLQLRWHFILIQDPKWMVAVCALAGRHSGVGGLG